MSGRKQHYIPQMLLKGFGAPRGKKTYVTIYHFDRVEFVVPTDGIAAERSFYSEIGEDKSVETLDDKITNYEVFISRAVSHVRSVEFGSLLERSLIGELITHLVVRNNYIRVSSTAIIDDFFNELGEVFSDKEAAKNLLGLAGDKPSKRLADNVAEILLEQQNEIKASGLGALQANDLAFYLLKSNFEQLHQTLQPLINALPLAKEQASEIAANSQKRGMELELSPVQRVERMMEFEWRVVKATRDLILPDCVAISIMKDGTAAPLMLSGFDDVAHILMPVSKDRILVGSRLSQFELSQEINRMMSCCSWDFFVAPNKSREFIELRKNIRVHMQDFSKQLAKGAIASAVKD